MNGLLGQKITEWRSKLLWVWLSSWLLCPRSFTFKSRVGGYSVPKIAPTVTHIRECKQAYKVSETMLCSNVATWTPTASWCYASSVDRPHAFCCFWSALRHTHPEEALTIEKMLPRRKQSAQYGVVGMTFVGQK